MKTKLAAYWIPITAAAAFLLGALLFKGCGAKVETQYLPVNLDSLKATIKRDTVILPGNQVTRIVRVPVLLSDTATIDSLLAQFEGQRDYYEGLIEKLSTPNNWGWDFGTVDLPMQTTVYADSIQTARYFHRWRIEAEGPIKNYTYGILPICPPEPALPAKKLHRIGLYVGGQTAPGILRPIVGASYGFGVIRLQGGFLPSVGSEKAQGQVLMGIEIPVK